MKQIQRKNGKLSSRALDALLEATGIEMTEYTRKGKWVYNISGEEFLNRGKAAQHVLDYINEVMLPCGLNIKEDLIKEAHMAGCPEIKFFEIIEE